MWYVSFVATHMERSNTEAPVIPYELSAIDLMPVVNSLAVSMWALAVNVWSKAKEAIVRLGQVCAQLGAQRFHEAVVHVQQIASILELFVVNN